MTLSKPGVLYEEDFNLWIKTMVELLRTRRFEELDVENLIDELENMSKRDRREVLSRLKVLLIHLLKWQYQMSKRSASWETTIRNNREEIEQILQDSPSLMSYPVTVLEQAYASARKNAASETSISVDAFPRQCPFSVEEVLSEAFLPKATC